MTAPLRTAWLTTGFRLAIVLAAGLILGLILRQPALGVATAALCLLGWQGWKLHAVLKRLDDRRRPPPSRNRGAWGALDALLRRNQRETRARRRRLLAMLRAYRTAAATLPDAILVVDRNRQRLLWFNAAGTRLLGLRHPQDRNAALAEALKPLPIARWLASGRNAEPLRDVPSPSDPGLRLDLRLLPYSDDLWLLIARDVSRMQHLEHVRRDFVANVSHELRTPLTVIHGYLELLDARDDPDSEMLLAEMRRQSERMARLVEDLLTLSRLEARDALPDEPVPMAAMLATLRREAEALSAGRHALTVEDSAGVDLHGAPRELHSAFSNLISNAVRYTPEGGTIALRFARGANGVAIFEVRDSGLGIPAEHLPRLTERFYRVSTSRSRETGGTGLGLAIVKHVLGLHGARLEIESTPGAGSCFRCLFGTDRTLPRSRAESEAAAP